VTDAQVAELEAELGRAGLVELTHSIALENMRARAYHALGIVDQGFDAACQVRLQG
jgi:alkylhydroperoxidase family enzyme